MRLLIWVIVVFVVVGCAGQKTKPHQENKSLARAMQILKDPDANKEQALEEFKSACTIGINYGCFKVGVAYNKGLYGTDADIVEAINWYMKAADKGYIPAQQNIANLYAYRQTKTLNDVEGYKWLELAMRATSNCETDSIAAVNEVSDKEARRLCALASQGQKKIQTVFRKRMDISEVEQAVKQANAWVRK